MYKKSFFLFIALTLVAGFLAAQEQNTTTVKIANANTPNNDTAEEGDFWDRIYMGGNLGAQFGSPTVIDVSPAAGYKINEHWLAGVGLTYLYYSYSDRYTQFSTSFYGGRAFTRYLILDNIFLHGEYEALSVERFDFIGKRILLGSWLAGGGYRQELGDGAFGSITILYNFNQSAYSPYINPIIRVGFGMGF